MQSSNAHETTHSLRDVAALFTALTALSEDVELEPMLDRVCQHVLSMGDFRSCVLGFYSGEESGYGLAGNLPEGTRERFYEGFLRSTPEGRAERRVAFHAHRRPGTNVIFLPAGQGPERSSAWMPTQGKPRGNWHPDDRLMVMYPGKTKSMGDDDCFAVLSLDDPRTGARPDEAVFGRLSLVEQFLELAAVHIENLLLGGRLRRSEITVREMFGAMPASVALINSDGKVLFSNRDEASDEGFPPLCSAGDEWTALEWSAEGIRRLVEDGVPLPATHAEVKLAGENWPVILSGAPVSPREPVLGAGPRRRRAVLVVKDASELLAIEAQLRETRKMEAVGRLAGGVAHEFNNLLTAVLGSVDLARDLVRDLAPPRAVELLNDATASAERGGVLTRQLLSFAKPTRLGFGPVDLSRVCHEVTGLLRQSINKRIGIRLECEPNLPPVFGDFPLLEQALLNLCLNARDALDAKQRQRPAGDDWSPQLTLTAEVEEDDAAEIDLPAVHVRIIDNGIGMDTDTLERAFEPFFSGQHEHDRVGLGLAMTYGVIQQHRGTVRASSVPGEGTQLDVWLPAMEEERVEGEVPVVTPSTGGRVLVVDDQAIVRRTLRRIAEQYGFEAVSVSSGLEAIEELARDDARFDVVVLDYTMPGMDGRETLEKLKERGIVPPPVIIITGDPSRVRADSLHELGVRGILAKPVRIKDLVRALVQFQA